MNSGGTTRVELIRNALDIVNDGFLLTPAESRASLDDGVRAAGHARAPHTFRIMAWR